MQQTKLIEFIFIVNNDDSTKFLGVFDIADISSITQFDDKHCLLTKKDSTCYKVCGTLRTLTNRWIYTLQKRIHLYEDEIIRPSVAINHNPLALGVDNIHFDRYQLEAFILSVNPDVFKTHPKLLEI